MVVKGCFEVCCVHADGLAGGLASLRVSVELLCFDRLLGSILFLLMDCIPLESIHDGYFQVVLLGFCRRVIWFKENGS